MEVLDSSVALGMTGGKLGGVTVGGWGMEVGIPAFAGMTEEARE